MAKFDKVQVTNDIRTRFGSIVTRKDLKAYKADTGIWARWIILEAPSAGRGQFNISTFTPSGTGKTRAPRAPKPVAVVSAEPVSAPAPVPVSDLVTANESASLSFAVSKSSSASDYSQKIASLEIGRAHV